ncbi:MAG TPA: efflux RND transporter periplasmic adaptor subunit [Gammaproteobacteria bacterium]|nr:efflux RND transporter periplasmic adaptor subunit [Gammaproteobacteria bacterium]
MSERFSTHPPGAEKPTARLCYVDDSRTAAFVMRRMLEPCGYQIDYFQFAEPAVVALIQGDYDLLLTDLKVSSSGMDGDDLIRTLRQSGQPRLSQLPIIVITGSTDAEALAKAYDAGANQVMSKPVDAGELDGHIRRLLLERHESIATQPQASHRESVDVPLVTPVQTAPVAEAKDNKTIPLLQVTGLSAENPPQERADVQASSENTVPAEPAPTVAPEAGMIERVVASDTASRPVSTPMPEPVIDTTPEAAPETATPDVEDGFRRGAAEPVEYDREREIIVDPEPSPGRRRRDRQNIQQGADDSRHGDNPFIFDEMPSRPANRLQRLFSRRTLLVVMVLAALGFAVFKGGSFFFSTELAVQTTFPEMGEIYQTVVVPGNIVSRQRVMIRPSRTGRLTRVLVNQGDRVQRGQLLARLDDRELPAHLEQIQAELAAAREDIERAERTWAQLRRSHEKGAVAERFVKDAEMKLMAARARASAAMGAARRATQVPEKQDITAPFSGTIIQRQAETGQWVMPTDSLFVLAGEAQGEIEVSVDAADSQRIRVGQVVLVTSDAFPGLEWQETVTRLDTMTGQEANAGPVKVFISLGAQAPDLRPGQTVDAEIRTAWNPHAIKVPFEALLNREGKVYLAVLQDGQVRMKPVIIGIEDFAMAEIRQGLGGHEEIILPRGLFLRDGDRAYQADDRD